MKKSKRFLCMLIAAVMLLGAFPAHAASAPPAATYKAASPVRLPDGTTGAKAGMTGAAEMTETEAKSFYGHIKQGQTSASSKQLFIGANTLNRDDTTVYCQIREGEINKIVGKAVPAGFLVDVYQETYDANAKKFNFNFVAQYDTRSDTEDLVIPCMPGDDPANPKLRKAPAPVKTQFADVQPGAWYYDAVTAVAKGKVIYTILDRDPNGNFKPDAILTGHEWSAIKNRLYGYNAEGDDNISSNAMFTQHTHGETPASKYSCYACRSMDPTTPDYVCPGMKRVDMMDEIGFMAMGGNLRTLKPSAYMKQNAESIARQKAAVSPYLDIWLDKAAKGETPCGLSPQNGYSSNYETLQKATYRGLESGVLVPETLNSWTDFVKPITRAELCVMLYRAGTTEFGSWLPENLTARINTINP